MSGIHNHPVPPPPTSGKGSSMVTHREESPGGSRAGRPPLIFNPDFFVEKLRHENPDVFLELVLSNITRLIDLPGAEFSQLLGEDGPKTPTGGNGGFFRSFNFLKRKGQKQTRRLSGRRSAAVADSHLPSLSCRKRCRVWIPADRELHRPDLPAHRVPHQE